MNDFLNILSVEREFYEILLDVQEHISTKYSTIMSTDPTKQKEQLKNYIIKYIQDTRLKARLMTHDELIEKLYIEMAEFSFLTKYLLDKNVEEININQWNDIKVTYTNGSLLSADEIFQSPSHAMDVIRRLLHQSGMILDHSQPMVVGHLSNNIRITAFGPPVIDKEKGVATSIRIVNSQKLSKDEFVQYETATPEMLDFLSLCLRYGISECITGATSSGKTTIMSWILSTIPNDKRVFTIENGTREFDLVKIDGQGNVINNVVHTVTRYSEDKSQNVDQELLLEKALTANPDVICVGEMKSAEAFAAQEAARTGHAVITTTHANSCIATYSRMTTQCKMKYDIDYETLNNLVTEAFPIVAFSKKLEDNSRKIMEITECEILPNGDRSIKTLYRYVVNGNEIVDGKLRVKGRFEKVDSISKSLQKRFLENGMPLDQLNNLLKEGV